VATNSPRTTSTCGTLGARVSPVIAHSVRRRAERPPLHPTVPHQRPGGRLRSRNHFRDFRAEIAALFEMTEERKSFSGTARSLTSRRSVANV
jgi:hypothetical protein